MTVKKRRQVHALRAAVNDIRDSFALIEEEDAAVAQALAPFLDLVSQADFEDAMGSTAAQDAVVFERNGGRLTLGDLIRLNWLARDYAR